MCATYVVKRDCDNARACVRPVKQARQALLLRDTRMIIDCKFKRKFSVYRRLFAYHRNFYIEAASASS